MNSHPDYSAAWRDYRKRRLIALAAFLGYIPGVLVLFFVIGLPIAAMSGINPDYLGISIGSLWMIAIMIVGMRAAYFRCPRCHNQFFATWWYRNQFARKCVHCGLPKWAASDVTLEVPPQSR